MGDFYLLLDNSHGSLDGAKRNPGSGFEPGFDPGLRLRLHPGYILKLTSLTVQGIWAKYGVTLVQREWLLNFNPNSSLRAMGIFRVILLFPLAP